MTQTPQTNISRHFYRCLPLGLLAVISLLFLPTLQPLAAYWARWDEGLSHGWLIIGVYTYLIWRSQPWAASQAAWPWYSALLLLAASLLWLGLQLVQIAVLAQLTLIAISALVFATVFGWRSLWRCAPILILPIYATSIWGDLTPALVELSSLVVGTLAKLVNIPAYIDGNSIFLPYGQIVIADGCSGGRYLVIGLAIGHLQACFASYRPKAFVLTLLVALLLGLAANWLRIFIIVMVAYFTHMQSALIHDHETFGWILFGVLMAVPMYFAPYGQAYKALADAPQARIQRLILGIACLAAGPILLAVVDLTPHPLPAQNLLNTRLTAIKATQMPMSLNLENIGRSEAGVDTEHQVYWQVNQYIRQSVDQKLVPYLGRGFDPEQWLETERRPANGLTHAATFSQFRNKQTQRQVVQLQWFVLGKHSLSTFWQAKLWQVPALLQGETRFVLVTLQTNCTADCNAAAQQLYASAQGDDLP